MEVYQERISDLPLLSHYIDKSMLVSKLNEHYTTHGNWVGPNIGVLVKGWLLYIISECDHRLYTVEDWASLHIHTLRVCLDCPDLQASAFQDDRLGKLLEIFSPDKAWETFQGSYTGNLLRIYSLETDVARVDSVNVPSYRSSREGSLFQYGHHKKHQPDTVQLKTMLVSLDPLALPLGVCTVSGNRNNELIYIPAIKQAEISFAHLNKTGILYVGDSKMANPATSSYLVLGKNYYLNPLSEPFFRKKDLQISLDKAFADASNIISVMEEASTDKGKINPAKLIAKVYELPARQRSYFLTDTQQNLTWDERVVLILSPQHAQNDIQDLDTRLNMVQKELLERFLPRKYRRVWLQGHDKDEQNAQTFVDNLLEKNRLKGLLDVQIIYAEPENDLKRSNGSNGDIKKEPIPLSIKVQRITQAIEQAKSYMGWRAYGTNAPIDKLPPTQVLKCYRDQFRIEHQFHRLLTKTTDLLPIYLKDEERIKALIRILILALQFVCIIQHIARQTLSESNEVLTDIVPGNKGRKVENPTAEALLKRFKNVSIISVKTANEEQTAILTHFDPVHQKILNILRCPDDLYLNFNLLFNMSMNSTG
jgi:transposase